MNNVDDQTYITIGKIGSTYGISGWLKIHTYTEVGTNILKYRPWYLDNGNNSWDAMNIEDGRVHNGGIIAKVAGYNTPEEARLLTGKSIAITRSQLPKLDKNEYYWSDLEGLTVLNKNGEILGKVSYLISTGANDVLVVKGDKEYAIPYLPGKVVTDINLEERLIYVDWELV